MKLLKSLRAIKRAKQILSQLPADLNTAVLSQQTEIEIQQHKIKKALARPLKYTERQILCNYLNDLKELKQETDKYLENKSKLNQAKAYNGVINIVKNMRKKYEKHNDLITRLAEGKNAVK